MPYSGGPEAPTHLRPQRRYFPQPAMSPRSSAITTGIRISAKVQKKVPMTAAMVTLVISNDAMAANTIGMVYSPFQMSRWRAMKRAIAQVCHPDLPPPCPIKTVCVGCRVPEERSATVATARRCAASRSDAVLGHLGLAFAGSNAHIAAS
jgi:hypothetical protein